MDRMIKEDIIAACDLIASYPKDENIFKEQLKILRNLIIQPIDIKDFIEEKKKEFEEKFCVFEGTDFKNNPMNPQLIWQWLSQSLQSAYEKAIQDAIEVCIKLSKSSFTNKAYDNGYLLAIQQIKQELQKKIDGE